ncbi:MAG: ABC transporter permease [Sphingomonadaceae bacterium]|uniref:ABC transporter permease n=1 Tax=Thermaurantiacus sp. TaxID=2820283 RepID=UPI00298F3392|nr:ABC transporter permease [Thermaurantiacus sp.]MCS6987104.1 ABC transporter permease [Sphingomonadaceae bacterium]MDW8415558.1 ABC transporter permease [Thermaurantiacus sp.]
MIGAMLAEAATALAANRLRSALTMLGMVIGVAAVILMLAIGYGVQRRVETSIAALGSNLLIVNSGAARTGAGIVQGTGTRPTLTLEDAEAIARLPGVLAAAPQTTTPVQVVAGPVNWATNVTSSTPAWFVVQGWFPEEGRAFSAMEERQGARVAVIGQTVARELFGAADPLGQLLRVRGVSFRVVGILPPRGQGIGGIDRDDVVVLPLTSSLRLVAGGGPFRRFVRTITVSVASPEGLPQAERAIAELLRRRHGLAPGQENDFSITNLTAVGDTFRETTGAISILLGAIGGISLVVGGIGIMNIMLVSVTERTREIGIRMAIGAPRAAVRLQFLLEALALSLVGCVAGVLLGVGLAVLASRVLPFATVVSLASVVAAFGISAAVGVFFGWWPASRAARLSPIEALRS